MAAVAGWLDGCGGWVAGSEPHLWQLNELISFNPMTHAGVNLTFKRFRSLSYIISTIYSI